MGWAPGPLRCTQLWELTPSCSPVPSTRPSSLLGMEGLVIRDLVSGHGLALPVEWEQRLPCGCQ